jgi:hypothetical protein
MKTKVSKILLILLLLLFPAISPTYNVYAQGDCILVSSSKINLSPNYLLNVDYLNSPEMKRYLFKCIKLSGLLKQSCIQELKEKLDVVEFFCFDTYMYDDKGRVRLNFWIPINSPKSNSPGILCYLPMDYGLRLRSHTV